MTTNKEFDLYEYNDTITLMDLHKYTGKNIFDRLNKKYGREITEEECQEIAHYNSSLDADDFYRSDTPDYIIKEENEEEWNNEQEELGMILYDVEMIADSFLNQLPYDWDEGTYYWSHEDLKRTTVFIAKEYFKEYCSKHYAKDTAWYISINWDETAKILSKNFNEIVINNNIYYYDSGKEKSRLWELKNFFEYDNDKSSYIEFNSKTLLEYREHIICNINKLKQEHYELRENEEDENGDLRACKIKEEVTKLTDRIGELNSAIEQLNNVSGHTWKDGINLIGKDEFPRYCASLLYNNGEIPNLPECVEEAIDWDKVASKMVIDYKVINLVGIDFYYYCYSETHPDYSNFIIPF